MSQVVSATAVPYFSQWETSDLTLDVIAEGSAALKRDPLWQASGAEDIDDYARLAVNACGMACLKMLLAARTGRVHPIVPLARLCETYGGYVTTEDGSIKGLIYAPFVPFVRERFGLEARVVTGIGAGDIAAILETSGFLIASVHHSIRWPEREPPSKGGHLVLVTAAEGRQDPLPQPLRPRQRGARECRTADRDLRPLLCRTRDRGRLRGVTPVASCRRPQAREAKG